MLVLSRRAGEKIIINDNIIVTVSSIQKPDQVRIGVEAPSEISIDREEIYLRKKGEQKKEKKNISSNTLQSKLNK
jgi:carbon storage regulator